MRLPTRLAPAAVILLVTSASAAPYTMVLRFPVGQMDKMTIAMDVDQTISSDVPPAPPPQQKKSKIGTELTLRVISSDESGASVEMTYDRIQVSRSIDGKEIAFDSAKGKAGTGNPYSDVAVVVGAKLTVHLTTEGKVDRLEGVDEWVKKMSQQIGGRLAANAAKQVMGEDRIESIFNAGFAGALPGKPVEIGATWQSNVSQNVYGMAVKMKTENKLVAVDGKNGHKIAKIEVAGNGVRDGNVPGDAELKLVQFDIKGTRSFDLDRGCFTETDTGIRMKGNITVPGPKGEMSVDSVINTKTSLTPAKAK